MLTPDVLGAWVRTPHRIEKGMRTMAALMKWAVQTIVVAASVGMLLTSAQAMEIDSGFMDTKWSTPAKDLPGYSRIGGKEKIAYYVNPGQKYTFFGTEVPNQVVYGFYEGKFFAVYADVDGIDIFSQIKSYIQHKYGVPRKTSREARGNLTTYVWRLKQTQIKLKHYETSGKMKISFYYLPIARQVNAEINKNLDAEPPGPVFPLSPFWNSEVVGREFAEF
jgi:hypothetical protein